MISDFEPLELQFTPSRKLYGRAMSACWKSYPLWPNRVVAIIMSFLFATGALLTGIVIGFLLFRFLAIEQAQRELAMLAGPLWLIAFYVLLRWQRTLLISVLEKSRSVFTPTSLTLSASCAVFRNANTEWRMDWSGIDSLVRFRGGFGFRIGNLVFPVPTEALPADLDEEQLLTVLRDRIGSAK